MGVLDKKMMRLATATIVLALAVAVLQRHLAQAQNPSKTEGRNENEAEVATRFAETLRLTTPKGTALPLRVEFKEWYLTRNARGTELPDQGFYIAHLSSGEVVTQVGDKSEARKPGDFWTVDKGTRMLVLIKAPREAAILQTLVLEPFPLTSGHTTVLSA